MNQIPLLDKETKQPANRNAVITSEKQINQIVPSASHLQTQLLSKDHEVSSKNIYEPPPSYEDPNFILLTANNPMPRASRNIIQREQLSDSTHHPDGTEGKCKNCGKFCEHCCAYICAIICAEMCTGL